MADGLHWLTEQAAARMRQRSRGMTPTQIAIRAVLAAGALAACLKLLHRCCLFAGSVDIHSRRGCTQLDLTAFAWQCASRVMLGTCITHVGAPAVRDLHM